MDILFTNFCANGEIIWDCDLMWHGKVPKFSSCFQQIVPILVPVLFLFCALPIEIYSNLNGSKASRSIPLNRYNLSRLIAVMFVVLLKTIEFGLNVSSFWKGRDKFATVNFVQPILTIITFIVFGILLNVHRRKGIHTSGVAWTFSLLSLVFSLPNVYMNILFYTKKNYLDLILFSINFSVLTLLFVLTCFADRLVKVVISNGKDRNKNNFEKNALLKDKLGDETIFSPVLPCPESSASFLSKILFSWFTPLMWKGYHHALEQRDLWQLDHHNSTGYLLSRIDRKLSPNSSKINPKFLRTIYRTFMGELIQGSILKMVPDMIQFLSPFMLKIFINYISDSSEPLWHGFVFAFIFFFASSMETMFLSQYFYRMYRLGARINTTLVSAIYRKSLRLSNTSLKRITTGEIINLMTVDVQRLVETVPFINMVWSGPLRIVFLTWFLYREIGVSIFAGLSVVLILIPINWYLGSRQRILQQKQMTKKDERIKVISEMLAGMRAIKLYGWELPFMQRIAQIRDEEIVQLQEIAFLNTFNSFTWTCAPFMVSFVTFAFYILSSDENVLDAKKAFVSLSMFNLMQFPLASLPKMITGVIMMVISNKRLNRYFNAPELESYVSKEDIENSIEIENASFAWEFADTDVLGNMHATKLILNDLNVKIPKKALVAIVGNVGSGKSSILSAILGDMERISGTVKLDKHLKIAHVSQQSWILNATLKDNILFGSPYNQTRYEEILEICALQQDIAILPGGDETEIGENGINLSGGQKQRVAIARACYSDASLYLFDDPLSAVDSNVGKHIFQKVLSSKTGYLRGKTRLLVTNNLSILNEVDQIVVMQNGTISAVGTHEQMLGEKNKCFKSFVQKFSEEPLEKEEDDKLEQKLRNKEFQINLINQHGDERAHLITTEHAEIGKVKATVYLYYFQSLTFFWLAMILCGYVGTQTFSVAANVWLAVWSNDYQLSSILLSNPVGSFLDNINLSLRNYRLIIFGVFGFFTGIFVLFGSISKEKAIVQSSVTLHRSLLESIMRSPIQFFDTTPIGRVLNRFSKDIDSVDNRIPQIVQGWLMMFLSVVFTLGIIVYQVPWFLVVMLPIIILYHFIQKFYAASARQIRRLESITRSPVYSFFSETLTGLNTIRAFAANRRFIAESNNRVDISQTSYYPGFVASKWLSVRLEFCGNLVVLFAAIFSVLSREAFAQHPGFVGLIITYALNITQNVYWLVRMTTDLETSVVSVERIQEYCHIPQEKQWVREMNSNPKIPDYWPERGAIRFVNYSVKYRETLDLVFDKINIDIRGGEKIGIVGRTGSGKSTLTLALFRLLEPESGTILIDGIDVTKIGLFELRSKLSIIPQDPVLFSGTIRFNLDPFGQFSDAQIWQALEDCHLKSYITTLELGLDFQLSENGANLSLGQRQLVCLGRTLLRQAKILVLDEATASVDLQTDSLIQKTIREKFSNCTVITIAHRLHSILDSDRVLVMDQGRVLEFASPNALLADPSSRFYSLAKDAGIN